MLAALILSKKLLSGYRYPESTNTIDDVLTRGSDCSVPTVIQLWHVRHNTIVSPAQISAPVKLIGEQ